MTGQQGRRKGSLPWKREDQGAPCTARPGRGGPLCLRGTQTPGGLDSEHSAQRGPLTHSFSLSPPPGGSSAGAGVSQALRPGTWQENARQGCAHPSVAWEGQRGLELRGSVFSLPFLPFPASVPPCAFPSFAVRGACVQRLRGRVGRARGRRPGRGPCPPAITGTVLAPVHLPGCKTLLGTKE